MTTNPIIAWLQETLQRLFKKSPSYFKVWNIILAIIAVVPQIPAALEYLEITVPTPWSAKISKIISVCGLIGLFFSKLTVKDATAIAADDTTNKLPFTAAKDLNTPK